MGGWYKLGEFDARQLALMIGQLSNDRNRVKRAEVALFLWSQMKKSGKPCPHFTIGLRTIAERCDTTPMVVRRFVERAEGDGWLVRVGTERNKGGEFTKRTFRWVAEEAADSSGLDFDDWVSKVRSKGVSKSEHTGVSRSEHTPPVKSQQKRTHRCVQNPPSLNTHTEYSSEYSEGAEHSPAPARVLRAETNIDQNGCLVDADGNILSPPTEPPVPTGDANG